MRVVEVRRRRLAAQRVTTPAATVADAVRHLGAVQAQDYGQSAWAVASRTRDATLGDVEQALADGAIVRTWPMRGTIHAMAPEDVRWWLALCARRTTGAMTTRLAQLDLTEADVERAGDLLAPELTGRRLLTRAEAMAVLDKAGLATGGQRGYHLLSGAAQRGVLCLGPLRGREQTFALLADWAPEQVVPEDPLAELARRYVKGHGPATDRDLAGWAGITLTQARAGLALAPLETTSAEGLTYWTSPEAPPPARVPGGLLLAGFDEYLLGYRGRSAVIEEEHFERVVPGGNGVFKPMVVLGGAISGVWQRKVTKAGIALTATLFDPAAHPREKTLKALALPAKRYADFLGVPLVGVDLA